MHVGCKSSYLTITVMFVFLTPHYREIYAISCVLFALSKKQIILIAVSFWEGWGHLLSSHHCRHLPLSLTSEMNLSNELIVFMHGYCLCDWIRKDLWNWFLFWETSFFKFIDWFIFTINSISLYLSLGAFFKEVFLPYSLTYSILTGCLYNCKNWCSVCACVYVYVRVCN